MDYQNHDSSCLVYPILLLQLLSARPRERQMRLSAPQDSCVEGWGVYLVIYSLRLSKLACYMITWRSLYVKSMKLTLGDPAGGCVADGVILTPSRALSFRDATWPPG